MTTHTKRHEEKADAVVMAAVKARAPGEAELSLSVLKKSIASALAATETELVARMMEELLNSGEKYAARQLAKVAAENNIPIPGKEDADHA